jgi:hypothetical protein
MRLSALEKASSFPGEKAFSPAPAPRSTWGHAGEDVSFCTRLKRAGGKLFVDSRVFVPHLKMHPYVPQILKGETKAVTALSEVEV